MIIFNYSSNKLDQGVCLIQLNERAKRAQRKGNQKIPEFEKFFPQGSNYEFYDFSGKDKYSKCDVPIADIINFGQNIHKPLYAFFAEINIAIDPTYSYVYHRSKKNFSFLPMNPLQIVTLNRYNENFYETWLNSGLFDPLIFVSYKTYQKSISVCKEMCRQIKRIYKKNPEDRQLACDKLFESVNRKLFKLYKKKIKFQMQENFEFHYENLQYLNQSLRGELGTALNNIKMGPSGGESFASFAIGVPAFKLKIDPIYIFPNTNSTILFALIPNSGFSFKLFEHYQSFYVLTKAFYNVLKNSPMAIQKQVSTPITEPPEAERTCPNCGEIIPNNEIFCPHCGNAIES